MHGRKSYGKSKPARAVEAEEGAQKDHNYCPVHPRVVHQLWKWWHGLDWAAGGVLHGQNPGPIAAFTVLV